MSDSPHTQHLLKDPLHNHDEEPNPFDGPQFIMLDADDLEDIRNDATLMSWPLIKDLMSTIDGQKYQIAQLVEQLDVPAQLVTIEQKLDGAQVDFDTLRAALEASQEEAQMWRNKAQGYANIEENHKALTNTFNELREHSFDLEYRRDNFKRALTEFLAE